MAWAISIAAAVTVAVTARLVHIFFLSGRVITGAGLFGRFVAATERARQAFADGWRGQTWRYRLVAYPCILASVGSVSLILYSALKLLGKFDSFWDVLLFCFFVFGFGVSLSLLLTFALIFGVYFLLTLTGRDKRAEDEAPPSAPQ